MPKITWENGDRFSFNDGKGYGMVLSNDKALLFEGEGGRTKKTVKAGNIPADAKPLWNTDSIPFEVSFAMEAASVAMQS